MRSFKIGIVKLLTVVFAMLMLGTSTFAQVSVNLPNVAGAAGSTTTGAITVGSLSNVYSFQFTVTYDKSKVYLTGISTDGTLLAGNPDQPYATADTANSKLVVAWASATPLTTTGVQNLIKINFKLRTGSGTLQFDPLNPFTLNSGGPSNPVTVTNGTSTVPAVFIQGGTINAVAGTAFDLPVTVQSVLVAGDNVYSYQFTATFDKSLISITSAQIDGTISAGGQQGFDVNTTGANGVVTFTYAGSSPLVTTGLPLLILKGTALAAGTSGLTFTSFSLNNGTPTSIASAGSVVVAAAPVVNVAPTLTVSAGSSVNENQAFALTLTGADANTGDVLTYSYTVDPAITTNAPVLNTSTGAFTWTPNYQQSGVYTFTFNVKDNATPNLFATPVVRVVTVNNVTTAPSFIVTGAAQMPNSSVVGGHLLSFTYKAIDAESDPITYSYTITPAATGAAVNPTTGVFTWTPAATASGSYQVIVYASDGVYTTPSSIATVTITPNSLPVIAPIAAQTGTENVALGFTVSATDANSDAIAYSYTVSPAIATNAPTLNAATGVFAWTPNYLQAGTYTFTFSASDIVGPTTTTVSVVIADVNRTPVLTAVPAQSVNGNSALSVQLAATDEDTDNTLTYSFTSVPVITGNVPVMSATGLFTWTPTVAQTGSYAVTFTVTDNKAATATQVTTVTVVNLAPTLTLNPVGPNFSVGEGSPLTVALVGADGNTGTTLVYSYTSTPAATGATFNTATGAFAWTPAVNQNGTYNVTFTVSDGYLTASVASVITVLNVNIAPTLVLNPVGPNFSVNEGAALAVQLVGADVNSGTTLTYSYVSTPAATGATFNPATGAFAWTPVTNQAGTYNVTFTVSDGSLSKSVASVITVVGVNIAPTLTVAATASVNEGQPLALTLTGADVNTGNVLTYSYTVSPAIATNMPTLNATTGAFAWTPDYTQSGLYTFTFKVTDQGGLFATKTTVVTVVNVNRAPVFTATLPANVVVQVHKAPNPVYYRFTYLANDPDGQPVAFSLVAGTANMSITVDGAFSWAPTLDQAGKSYTVSVQVSDGTLTTTTTGIITASATITGVEDLGGVPTEFSLMQNYPNPFNPTTSIRFALPSESQVKLTVFNMLGQEVASLFQGTLAAGNHKVDFDASKLTSGMYIYRIEAGSFVSVKKMLLMK